MFAKLSEIIWHHLGWCPNTGIIRTAQQVIIIPPVAVNPAQPDGGAGGSGRIDRSFTLAMGSIKILFKNKRLLWFSFLTGLVLLFNLISMFGLQALSGTFPFTASGFITWPDTALLVPGSPVWLTLTFMFQLVAMFGSSFLLAGLVTCVFRLFSDKTATIGEGLSHARNHVGAIAVWAAIIAIASTVQQVITTMYPEDIFLIISSILIFSILGLLTTFVIPLLVLEDRSLISTVTGSVSIFRQTWAEILLCTFIYCLFAIIMIVLALIPTVAAGFPSGNPGLLGITMGLYLLVLLAIGFIGSTLIGIVLVGLYSYAKSGQLPRAFTEN